MNKASETRPQSNVRTLRPAEVGELVELRPPEEGWRELFEAAPVALIIMRVDSHALLRGNRRAFELFELDAVSAAEGRPAHDLWADPRERRALEEEVHRRGAIEGLRARLRSATGREFRAELAARRLIVEGAPAVLISVRDRSREHEEEARLREQALRDPLTGLFNRRHFLAAGEQAAARGARRLSLAMLDIDHFKRINDRYGHSTGDQVLTLFAGTCEGGLRARDLLARYGGEEFVVLFLDTDSAVARSVCERVRRAVEHLTFPTPDGGTDRFTLSIGVVERQHGESLASLVRRADARLYEAKAAGRNQLAV